jgi:hypothetical protein
MLWVRISRCVGSDTSSGSRHHWVDTPDGMLAAKGCDVVDGPIAGGIGAHLIEPRGHWASSHVSVDRANLSDEAAPSTMSDLYGSCPLAWCRPAHPPAERLEPRRLVSCCAILDAERALGVAFASLFCVGRK